MSKSSKTRKQRALEYASQGLRVVPMHTVRDGVCSCSKGKVCSRPGKHPMTLNGVKNATSNRKVVRQMWNDNPGANIGIATGPNSNLIVLDVDPRNGGTRTLCRKRKELGKLPVTPTSDTGGGGMHLIFRHPSFPVRKDTAGKCFGSGIDVLAKGSIMIAPPSRHASGRRYRWQDGKAFKDVGLADLPDSWLEGLRRERTREPGSKLASTEPTTVSEGGRNDLLTSLAGRLWNTGIKPESVLSALVTENEKTCDPPLDLAEVKKIAASITRKPAKSINRDSYIAEQVMRLVLQQHFDGRKHLMFCNDGQFWRFDSRKWVPMNQTSLQRRILKTLQRIPDRRRHSTSSVISQVMTLIKAKVAVDKDRLRFLTEPPNVINCANGELWISDDGTFELRPHDSKSYLRHCLDIRYRPAANCPLYDATVREIFSKAPDTDSMVRHWHEICGYFISPRRKVPKIIVLRGRGSNGKTKLMETVTQILGQDLVSAFRIENLEKNRFAIGSLLGKTLLVDDDVRAGARLPDGELKKISEPKALTGERKFGPPFNFVVRTVPVLICNNVPSLADLSWGMQRRLTVIPFDRTFTKKDSDPDLFRKIWATELPGILNHCLKGLQRLQQRNGQFNEPRSVKAATGRWLADANPLPAFIDDCCVRGSQASCWMKEFYPRYCDWSQQMGFTLRQQQPTVRRNLEPLGFTIKHGNQGDKIFGLKLRP